MFLDGVHPKTFSCWNFEKKKEKENSCVFLWEGVCEKKRTHFFPLYFFFVSTYNFFFLFF